jgi:hypothetical protein
MGDEFRSALLDSALVISLGSRVDRREGYEAAMQCFDGAENEGDDVRALFFDLAIFQNYDGFHRDGVYDWPPDLAKQFQVTELAGFKQGAIIRLEKIGEKRFDMSALRLEIETMPEALAVSALREGLGKGNVMFSVRVDPATKTGHQGQAAREVRLEKGQESAADGGG